MSDTNNQFNPEDYAKLIELYKTDVGIFAQQVFGFTLSPKQKEIADAVQNNRLVTVRGAISIGKTAVMAVLAWHNLVCYPEVLVTLWGPNEGNLRDGVVRAMREFHDKMAEPFKSLYECGAERFFRKLNGASCYAQMRLASKERPDAARGLHQTRNVVLADECTEIEDTVLEILMNILSDPDPRILLISNPSKRTGFYAKTHLDPEISEHWVKIHASIWDAPNYDEERTKVLVSQYGGVTSTRYRSMVLGEFGVSDVEGLISLELIETAVKNEEVEPAENVAPIWGVDPAFKGDASVLCIRRDNTVLAFHEWHGLDATQLSYAIRDLYQQTPKALRPSIIAVDSTGLGHGVASNLKDFGLPLNACVFASTPNRLSDRYHRTRDLIWGEMASWMATENVSIPNNPKLIEELASATYDDSTGKIKLLGKKEMKKILGRSPDFADALAITFSPNQSRSTSKFSWSKPIEYAAIRSFE